MMKRTHRRHNARTDAGSYRHTYMKRDREKDLLKSDIQAASSSSASPHGRHSARLSQKEHFVSRQNKVTVRRD